MNVGIRKLMRRKGSVKGGYDRRSLTRRGMIIGGRKHFGGGESSGFGAWIFWFCVGVLQSWRIITGGTGLLGVLGTGARIALRYPGARKPDRLLLAGREETRFGQSWSVHQATTKQQAGQPGQRRN
jgi:hypothetical protein